MSVVNRCPKSVVIRGKRFEVRQVDSFRCVFTPGESAPRAKKRAPRKARRKRLVGRDVTYRGFKL